MAELPAANSRGDVTWLMAQAQRLADRCSVSTVADARAALRDLGFLVAAAVRHVADLDISAVEPVLLRLGRLTDEVPRDSVYSYSTRNPDGARRRSFTGTPEEELFISSVAEATASLNIAVECLNEVLHNGGAGQEQDERLLSALQVSRSSVDVLRTKLLEVKRQVSPELFSGQLRPCFPELTVGGTAYAAPGGAQMPLMAMDVILFDPPAQAPADAAWHNTYLDENVRYLPPAHRAVCAAARTVGEPLATGVTLASLARTGPAREELALLLKDVLRFRHPHRQLARENMQIRPDGSLGSGGYTDAVLDRIIDLNQQTLRSVKGGR